MIIFVQLCVALYVQCVRSIQIVFDQKNNTIQQTANTITFNITTTFSASSDIEIAVQLPSQIQSQENIVCGITGLTNGACNLVYSKFIITFKSATPTFQIIFINVNNPITTFNDPVQMNASIIATKQSIFTETVQLIFQSKNVPISITQPITTYITSPLLLLIDGSSIQYPALSQVVITTNGIISQETLITGVKYDNFILKNGILTINNVILQSNSKNQINITLFTIQSNKPISYQITIQDNNQGLLTSYNNQMVVQNINNNYSYVMSNDNYIIGMQTKMNIQLCNLSENSLLTFKSNTLVLVYETKYDQGCHTTTFQQFNNPLTLVPNNIDLSVTLDGYDSVKNSIQYILQKDTIQMSMSQNTTIMLNTALIILSLQFNQQFQNFQILLNNQYETISCYIQDIACTQLNQIFKSQQITSALNKATVKLEVVLPGCDQYSFSASLLINNQELAISNQQTPNFTKYKLNSMLQTSSFEIGQKSTFTITGLDSSQITSYQIATTLSNIQCSDCIQQNNYLQYGQATTLEFTATNFNNIKPYTITLTAYKDTCLIAEQQFKQQANPQALSIAVTTDNNYQYAQANWQVTIAPDLQDKGILKLPFLLQDSQENKINSSSVYINSTTMIYNLTNLYNDQEVNFWQISYFRDGFLYAYGNTTLPTLQIKEFSNITIIKSNSDLLELDNLTISFNTDFDIPQNGKILLGSTNLVINNVTCNDQNELTQLTTLKPGQQTIKFNVSLQDQMNYFVEQFKVTSFDNQGRIIQKSIINYTFNYSCSFKDCSVCSLTECKQCKQNFSLLNNTCSLQCKINQTIVNNKCVDNQTSSPNNTNNQTNNNNANNQNTTTDINLQDYNSEKENFKFTPPIISPIMLAIFLFALSRKCWNSESETFIIYYSISSILEHTIHIFLFIYCFVTLNFLYGFCMISVIIMHFSLQLYLVFMNMFKIDPEYIGIRQQNIGMKILHIFSLTFCGRLLLLLISKLGQSYMWSTPWTYKISVLQRLSNYLKFQIIQQIGVLILVIFLILQQLYFLYIEILSFQIIQIAVTLYSYKHLRDQKNLEIRFTYV